MLLQYFDILKGLGSGPAAKFIFHLEFLSLLKPLQDFAEAVGKK